MLVLNNTPFVHARVYLQYFNSALPGGVPPRSSLWKDWAPRPRFVWWPPPWFQPPPPSFRYHAYVICLRSILLSPPTLGQTSGPSRANLICERFHHVILFRWRVSTLHTPDRFCPFFLHSSPIYEMWDLAIPNRFLIQPMQIHISPSRKYEPFSSFFSFFLVPLFVKKGGSDFTYLLQTCLPFLSIYNNLIASTIKALLPRRFEGWTEATPPSLRVSHQRPLPWPLVRVWVPLPLLIFST